MISLMKYVNDVILINKCHINDTVKLVIVAGMLFS